MIVDFEGAFFMHVRKHLRRAVIAMLGVTPLLSMSPGAAQEKTLRVVMHSDLRMLDPVLSSTYIVRNHGYMVYDTLFAMDEAFEIRPQMVESWRTSEDTLVTTITLREGLTWHDGTMVTSEDCIASLKRWSARDPIGQKLANSLREYRAIDERTFEIVLREPFGALLEALAKPSGTVPFMMPRRVAETDPFQQIGDPTGSGPFVLDEAEWRPGDKVVYLKNRHYKPRAEPASGLAGGKVVNLDRVEWISMPNVQTQVSALLVGEIDMIESMSHDLLPQIERASSVKLIASAASMQYIFRMNWLQPPFNNKKIRQAVFMALSQEDYLQVAIGNRRYWRTCKALFACGAPLESEAGMHGLLEGDSLKAGELLREAGYDGTPVVLLQPVDVGILASLAPVAKAQLERAGFKVDVQAMDWQTLIGRISNKGPPSRGGWNAYITTFSQMDVLNPLTSAYLMASCEKAYMGWPCDAEMETLRGNFARATDANNRHKIAEEIQILNTKIGVEIPLGEFFPVGAVRNNIVRAFPSPPVTVFWGIEKK